MARHPLDLSERHLDLLRGLLARWMPGAEVWAYGSRVNGTAHEGSDLDLVLRNPGDLERDVEHWAELREALQESRLPMLVDVHQWSRLPMPFRQEIERRYVVLQGPAQTD